MRGGRPFLCADAATELPEGADREAYLRTGIRALITLPVHMLSPRTLRSARQPRTLLRTLSLEVCHA